MICLLRFVELFFSVVVALERCRIGECSEQKHWDKIILLWRYLQWILNNDGNYTIIKVNKLGSDKHKSYQLLVDSNVLVTILIFYIKAVQSWESPINEIRIKTCMCVTNAIANIYIQRNFVILSLQQNRYLNFYFDSAELSTHSERSEVLHIQKVNFIYHTTIYYLRKYGSHYPFNLLILQKSTRALIRKPKVVTGKSILTRGIDNVSATWSFRNLLARKVKG